MFTVVSVLFMLSFIPFVVLILFIIIRKINKKNFNKRLKNIQENSPYRKSQNNIKPTNDFLFLEKEEPNLNKEYALERVEKIHTKEHDRTEESGTRRGDAFLDARANRRQCIWNVVLGHDSGSGPCCWTDQFYLLRQTQRA